MAFCIRTHLTSSVPMSVALMATIRSGMVTTTIIRVGLIVAIVIVTLTPSWVSELCELMSRFSSGTRRKKKLSLVNSTITAVFRGVFVRTKPMQSGRCSRRWVLGRLISIIELIASNHKVGGHWFDHPLLLLTKKVKYEELFRH